MGARKGSEDWGSAEELPEVPQPSCVERAATFAVWVWVTTQRHRGDARKDHETRDEKASAHLVGEVSWSARKADVAV
jgi:hypothetical protein